ncbi:MAG TPA: chromate efflux transporter [Bryobacteraceae bacterium]|nr:chromate efflux transporter [Bryobacteraceae bacterium]
MDKKAPISLARLLLLFLKIGSVGFGGGMAIISVMERELVRKRKLLPLGEFLHGVGFGQILGSFAINAALFAGYRLYGAVGGLLSAAAFLAPSLAMVVGLSALYFRYHAIPALAGAVAGLGPVVIALIVEAAWSIAARVLRSPAGIAVALAALAAGLCKVNALWVLGAAGAIGILLARVGRPAPPASPEAPEPFRAWMAAPVLAGGSLGALATTFFKVGLLFFGGGFVLIPVLSARLVTELHWLTAREFIDGVAISNLTPGPIAVLATFAGFHLAGVTGALIATAALLAPAAILMLVLSRQYERFCFGPYGQGFLSLLNPAIAGLILSAAFLLGGGVMTSWPRWIFGAACLLVLRKLEWPPVILLAAGALAGYAGLLP